MPSVLFVSTISRFLRDFLLPFSQHFRAQGWRIDGLTNEVDAFPECAKAFDRLFEIQWSRSPMDPRNLHHTLPLIERLVEEQQYDIVHVHTPVAAFVTRLALRRLRREGKVKVVYTAHGFHFHPEGNPLKNGVFLSLEKIAGRWTDELVVMNHEDRDAAFEHRLVAPEHLHYMPGIGVDLQYYNPKRISRQGVVALQQELALPPQKKIFAIVAEFIPRKRHEDAVRAMAQVNDPDIHLACAGCGPLQEEVRQLARRFHLSHRVHLLGFRQCIPELFALSTAAILPSRQEGLPRCVLEAMSQGLPVIGTNIRGTRQLLKDDCGLLVPVGDVSALAQAMEWIASHPAEAQAIGLRGQREVGQYDLSRIIAMHDDLYARTLGITPAAIPRAA